MATKEALVQVINAAVLGDENAITVLAQYLEGGPQASVQEQINAAIRARDAEWAQREAQRDAGLARFRSKVTALSKEYPVLDSKADSEGYQAAAKLEAIILAKRPDLDEDERLHKVAETITKQLGDPEDRDKPAAIELMRQSRMPAALRESAAEDEIDVTDQTDDVEEELERERSKSIALMARERGPRPGVELTEDQKIKRRRASEGR